MTVGFCKELNATGSHQLPEEFEHFGSVLLDEFERDAADAKCHLEGFAVFVNHVEHCLQGWLVALFCQFGNDALVLVVIIVIVVGTDVEETITLEVYRLVYLEV